MLPYLAAAGHNLYTKSYYTYFTDAEPKTKHPRFCTFTLKIIEQIADKYQKNQSKHAIYIKMTSNIYKVQFYHLTSCITLQYSSYQKAKHKAKNIIIGIFFVAYKNIAI